MASGRHQPEGVDRVLEGELGDRKHPQLTVADTRKDVLQEPAVPLGLQPQIQVEIDDRERRALGQCRQAEVGVGVDVLLTQLDESATGSKDLHTSTDRFARQRVEDDVDSVTACGGHDLVGEVEDA